MSEKVFEFPEKEYETLRMIILKAIKSVRTKKCTCESCRGLVILAKNIAVTNEGGNKEIE